MPYKSNDDLPANIRKMYSTEQQSLFRRVWNSVFEESGDEGKAFAIAHSVVREEYKIKEKQESKLFDELVLSPQQSSGDIDFVVGSAKEYADNDVNFVTGLTKKCGQIMLDRFYLGDRLAVIKKNGQLAYRYSGGEPVKDALAIFLYDAGITSAATALSNDDFIIEATLAEKNRQKFLVLNDLLFLGRDMTHESLFERKKLLSRLNYVNSLVKEQKTLPVTLEELPVALKLYDKISNGSGCIIRENSAYSFKEIRSCRYHG